MTTATYDIRIENGAFYIVNAAGERMHGPFTTRSQVLCALDRLIFAGR